MKQLYFGEIITEEEYDALVWLGSKKYAGETLSIVYINIFRFSRAQTEWCDHCLCRFYLWWDLPRMEHKALPNCPGEPRDDSILMFFERQAYKPRKLIFNTMDMEDLIKEYQADEEYQPYWRQLWELSLGKLNR